MNPSIIKQADDILDTALTLPSDQRQAYVTQRCAGNNELCELVQALLGNLLEDPTMAASPVNLELELAAAMETGQYAGRRLGPYRLQELAGSGGMGQVYQARRDDGYFEQQVAIKVLPEFTRVLAADAVQRFGREIRLMGALQHAHIAQVFDAGIDDEGTPYFAMEWVDGQPITEWCEQRQLGLKARLNLWLQAAEAVQAAHHRFIVHRDLKPANVFVDTRAGVKVLDFGIAQSLEEPSPDGEPLLAYSRWLSCRYASPEQLRQQPVGSASDQYQLGLLLYQLVTGVALRDESVNHPVAALDMAVPANIASIARVQQRDWWRQLRGDLNAILQRMLMLEPGDRYAGVNDAIADVRAWLSHRPISLRQHRKGYVMRRLARRHWAAVSAAAAVLTAIVVFAVNAQIQRDRLAQEQQRTAAELQRSQQMLQFLYSMFDQADPYEEEGAVRDVAAILLNGLEQAREEFRDDPLTQAQVAARISIVLSHVGNAKDALTELYRVNDLLQQLPAASPLDLGTVAAYIGQVEFYLDNAEGAAEWLQRSVDYLSGINTADAVEQLAVAYNNLGRAHEFLGDYRQQRHSFELALALFDEDPKPVASTKALTLHNLAVASEDPATRLQLEKEVLAIRLQEYGEGTPTVLHTRFIIATLEGLGGNTRESIAQFERSLPRQRELLGADHRDRAIQLIQYSRQLINAGRFEDAVTHAREAVRINALNRSAESAYTVFGQYMLAQALMEAGEHQQALEYLNLLTPLVNNPESFIERYCLPVSTALMQIHLYSNNMAAVDQARAMCDLERAAAVPNSDDKLRQYQSTVAMILLRNGQWLQAREITADFFPVGLPDIADSEFMHWRDCERQLLYAISHGSAVTPRLLDELSQLLGADHWRVQLYQQHIAMPALTG
ncbi:MAG: hypothetical protein Tsb002_03300 [Wenzhouxiangellaceae bacterium]